MVVMMKMKMKMKIRVKAAIYEAELYERATEIAVDALYIKLESNETQFECKSDLTQAVVSGRQCRHNEASHALRLKCNLNKAYVEVLDNQPDEERR